MFTRAVSFSVVIFAAVLLAGCEERRTEEDDLALSPCSNPYDVYEQNQGQWVRSYGKEPNLILYVATTWVGRVDIKVHIDGLLAISGKFSKETPSYFPPRTRKFKFFLPQGTHELKAESAGGSKTFVGKFELTGKHWGEVALGGRGFYFHFQDKPIVWL